MAWADELRAAIGTATRWRRDAELALPARVAGLAWLPAVGAVVGAAAAALERLGASVSPLAGAVFAVAALEALAGRRAGAAAVAAAVKVAAVAVLPAGARAVPLVLAAALGRWAVVVQCYGGRPAVAHPSALVGRARFREFGIASVTAIGGALVVLDAVGLLTVLASALATIALRTRAYRTHGGLDDATLARTDAVVEAVVLATLAAVARAAGAAA